jgi:hypothetical protein
MKQSALVAPASTVAAIVAGAEDSFLRLQSPRHVVGPPGDRPGGRHHVQSLPTAAAGGLFIRTSRRLKIAQAFKPGDGNQSLGYFQSSAGADEFGVRRQSEAATALWIDAFDSGACFSGKRR